MSDVTQTRLTVSALLDTLIDYAGLFPPAKLDMGPTVRNYAGYVAGDDAWMLARLIVPAARLDEFETEASGLLPTDADGEPWHLSCLTAPADDDALDGHLERIAAFNAKHDDPAHGLARIDVIELRAGDADSVEDALDAVPEEVFPFFEVSVDTDPRGLLAALVGSDAGAKVRTGGLEPSMYPEPGHLARFIGACVSSAIPFKATAGLHHPVRHFSEAVGTEEFGFLNVFLGAAFTASADLAPDRLVEILTETDAAAFRFDDGTVTWRDLRLDADEIDDARTKLAVSFGSCSFDEPREDLRRLGLLA